MIEVDFDLIEFSEFESRIERNGVKSTVSWKLFEFSFHSSDLHGVVKMMENRLANTYYFYSNITTTTTTAAECKENPRKSVQ